MKKKFVMNRDRIFSIGMALVSILIMGLTTQIRPTFGSISGSDPGSKAFPFGIAILLLLSSIGKFITCSKALLLWIMRGRQKISAATYVVYPAVLTAVLYILFNNILQVIMPVGQIWKAIL